MGDGNIKILFGHSSNIFDICFDWWHEERLLYFDQHRNDIFSKNSSNFLCTIQFIHRTQLSSGMMSVIVKNILQPRRRFWQLFWSPPFPFLYQMVFFSLHFLLLAILSNSNNNYTLLNVGSLQHSRCILKINYHYCLTFDINNKDNMKL